mmetsp:Transcript_17259/g.23759  ORF Transcript_17259/g.23759 Transcript_17259/m.23759 type:complete len:147 (-) Transcript_17259:277-717(-)|eukprot:CAMPEP_0185729906 /NCGR_PEP_ID=MMETSP1171-20130828/7749_1 /TAXON_ID=374046 /ORGANISM="Helicotheca tamensis, Strain CCMP826" /LENGTH=146 /DNA_ID=CAMNT_0028398847 /DNA_START=110 /DNA_END=550 /DNA_ORIENTATION=-
MSFKDDLRKNRKSLTELSLGNGKKDSERLEDKVTELELMLEFERSKRRDACDFARSIKRKRVEETFSDEDEEEHDQKETQENQLVKRFQEELFKKDDEIQQLKTTINRQEKKICMYESKSKSCMHVTNKEEADQVPRRNSTFPRMA